MKDSEKIKILDDMIFNLEIDQERIAVMTGEIDQDYFDLNDDNHKLYYFDNTGIKFDILSDYVIRMGGKLTEIRKILNEWHGSSEKKGGAS